MKKYIALWDTGATNSGITSKVVHELNLKPIRKTQVTGVNGTTICNVYLVDIILPMHVGFENVEVTEINITGFEVLIGMDIIMEGDFAISNANQKTLFSYCVPSIKNNPVDLVEKAKHSKR
jgi:hypothetical protein